MFTAVFALDVEPVLLNCKLDGAVDGQNCWLRPPPFNVFLALVDVISGINRIRFVFAIDRR